MPPNLKPSAAPPTSLAAHTRAGLIVSELTGRDAAGIIHELSQALQREHCVPDVLAFYHTALNHQLLFNSVLDSGIAVPHARLNAVSELQFAFGRAPEPVTWGARGARTVDLVFLIAVPATNAASYLHLLAAIARLGACPNALAALREAGSPESIREILGGFTIG